MKLDNIIQEPISPDKKPNKSLNKPQKESKLVVLQPIGYPFLCNLVENPKIEIFDKMGHFTEDDGVLDANFMCSKIRQILDNLDV